MRKESSVLSPTQLIHKLFPEITRRKSSRLLKAVVTAALMVAPTVREFFGDRFRQTPEGQERLERGLGSGVVVSADGHILTNHHVVDGAEQIQVELTDRRVFQAKIVGSDQPSDLAVLKVDTTGLPVLP